MKNKPTTEPTTGTAPAFEPPAHTGSPTDRAATREEAATYIGQQIDAIADDFAQAMLRNPSVAQFLYGDPLQPHRCGDHASVGAYLAHACHRLAVDYFVEREQMRSEWRRTIEHLAASGGHQ